jgi:hypothetical protein
MTATVTEEEVPFDPQNDPDHPIPFLRVIDVAAYKVGSAELSIIVAGPLDGSPRSQTRLLDKIQGYLGHISSGEFAVDAGCIPTEENTRISVHLHPESSELVRNLLFTCHDWVRANNASLVVRDLDI